ncbi:hypothetical protein AG1IA_04853 [Rhizoctonia solani AG-1 IA]|uniref:Uncharacterized protein n=1 Tax=Thanatephorus cucumeris (strain AG1-IA) TaxID=983506 RepID=L8WSK6_THACA|nr:hypothetical protein AG1IA_04853 [Rhizoctonia solani AG-1 IA]
MRRPIHHFDTQIVNWVISPTLVWYISHRVRPFPLVVFTCSRPMVERLVQAD